MIKSEPGTGARPQQELEPAFVEPEIIEDDETDADEDND